MALLEEGAARRITGTTVTGTGTGTGTGIGTDTSLSEGAPLAGDAAAVLVDAAQGAGDAARLIAATVVELMDASPEALLLSCSGVATALFLILSFRVNRVRWSLHTPVRTGAFPRERSLVLL
jgi:hypothetical protein